MANDLERSGGHHPRVVVVIPNWNLKNDLSECLDTLSKSTYPNLEVVVVDNASSDGSAAHLAQNYPWVTLVALSENSGYAGGINAGIRAVWAQQPDYILALNNDTLLPEDTITALVQTAESDPGFGIIAPKIFYHPSRDRIFSLGDRVYKFWPVAVRYAVKAKNRPAFDRLMEFDYVIGCAMLIRAQVIREIGLFDTSFFMFFEDSDFCRRARDAGWRVIRDGRISIFHKASLSVRKVKPQMTRLRARNRIRFYRRYRHGPLPLLTQVALLAGTLFKVLGFFFSGQWAAIPVYLRGTLEGLREGKVPARGTELPVLG